MEKSNKLAILGTEPKLAFLIYPSECPPLILTRVDLLNQ